MTDKLSRPTGLAVDASAGIAYVCTSGSLTKVTLTNGATATVATGLGDPHTVVLDGQGHAYTPDIGGRTGKVDLSTGKSETFGPEEASYAFGIAMAPAKDSVYVLHRSSGPLFQLDTTGKLVKKFDLPSGDYHSVAIDHANAYVVRDFQAILRVDLGTGKNTSLADGFSTLYDLALDGHESLYVPDYDTGILWRVNLTSGEKEQVTTGFQGCHGMGSDGKNAYVTRQSQGKLLRVSNVLSPVRPPTITTPKENDQVPADQVIKGTVPDADKVTLTDGATDLGAAELKGTDWTLKPKSTWAFGKHEVSAVAHKATEQSLPTAVHFTVADHNLKTDQKLNNHWQQNGKYIYSYDLTIHAEKDRVYEWTVSFDARRGAVLDPAWVKEFWAKVDKDGSDGRVVLSNVDEKHTIDPDTPLTIRVRMLCPSEDAIYNQLDNLVTHQTK
ncbi:streptogramin lyase [Saccharopolyspora phatthalungensis]|uniref:Streptogramin lyase n=1 Tax=Saccharopolyspora phatthalungensis TaxID=664693 RepID=A0A840QG88_9PSEU|nr:streptogramin lyase [Saccharopolyspora phatthalungensis]